jgi:hypothetical protein
LLALLFLFVVVGVVDEPLDGLLRTTEQKAVANFSTSEAVLVVVVPLVLVVLSHLR